jgi:hypothetical protein
MKNIIILGFLTFVTLSYAKEPIEKESMEAEESFKVEKAVTEKAAGRAFAGSKAKKESTESAPEDVGARTEDSEVQYWKYQEE